MDGYYEYKLSTSTNTLEILYDGPNNVVFPGKQTITFTYPKIRVHGILFGDRLTYPSGSMMFEDVEHHLKAVVIFNYGKKRSLFGSRKPGTKLDDVDGLIYYAQQGAKSQKSVTHRSELTDVERPVSQISGSWLRSLKIGGTVFWDIDQVVPYPLLYTKEPLPSDCRYREDIIWLRRGRMDYAQDWKLRLEAEQRRAAALHAAYTKSH